MAIDKTLVGRKPVCYSRSEGMNWNSGRKMKTMACSSRRFQFHDVSRVEREASDLVGGMH